jgi:hypothetical protein
MLKILPLCRKEKYYTSCILPQLICGDEMQRLNDFLSFLSVDRKFIHDSYSSDNLLFYTEYSLKESADWVELANHPSKETPDLILLIKSKDKNSYLLIVVEAKMFNKTSASEFNKKIELQKSIVEIIKNKLGIKDKNYLHICLFKDIPRGYKENPNERIITWSDILTLYKYFRNNYFYKILKYAIEDPIVSKPLKSSVYKKPIRGKNYLDLFSFSDIVKICKDEGSNITIGFNGGKKVLQKATLDYLKNRKYKWDYVNNPKGKKVKSNWINGTKFQEIISNKYL